MQLEELRKDYTRYFNNFILEAGLKDFIIGGQRFTYFCHDGAKLRKLDRFLVCSNFLSSFPGAKVTAHTREMSDHCQVTLITKAKDYGPPPFKLFNSWLLMDVFGDLVDAFLLARFKSLKNGIKKWIHGKKQVESKEFNELKETIDRLDRCSISRPLSDLEQTT